ncbi:hypothetical protein PFISCL1PPCAC_16737, partial [Pristionchus fissidentatus]
VVDEWHWNSTSMTTRSPARPDLLRAGSTTTGARLNLALAALDSAVGAGEPAAGETPPGLGLGRRDLLSPAGGNPSLPPAAASDFRLAAAAASTSILSEPLLLRRESPPPLAASSGDSISPVGVDVRDL